MADREPVGTIGALWRFPVKSMLGEQLDAVDVTEGGIVGDRAYALIDQGDREGREREASEGVARPAALPSFVRRTAACG